MQICIFEDSGFVNFEPLSLSRPVYELFCGINTLKEKIISVFPDSEFELLCRDYLAETVKTNNPKTPVNKLKGDSCLLINGRLLEPEKLLKQIPEKLKESIVYINNENVAAAFLTGKHFEILKNNPQLIFDRNFFEGLPKENTEAKLVNYIWEFIGINGKMINSDVKRLVDSGNKKVSDPKADKYPGVHFIDKKNIFIGNSVTIKPGVVIDATEGFVFIDNDAEIFPNVVITYDGEMIYKCKYLWIVLYSE